MQHNSTVWESLVLPAASATVDPTMAPIALLARAAAICKHIHSITDSLNLMFGELRTWERNFPDGCHGLSGRLRGLWNLRQLNKMYIIIAIRVSK